MDQELNGNQSEQIKEHLRRCPDCAGRLVTFQQCAKVVNTSMERLAPTPRDLPRAPQQAFQQFSKIRKEIPPTMFTKRSFWAFLGVVAVLALALSITPVRAWASSMLSLFRVQQVTVISFDPQAAREGRENLSNREDVIRQVFEDNLEIVEQGKVQSFNSADEAAQVTGFVPRLPVQNETAQYYVKPGMLANFTIDQPTLQALIDAANVDMRIPNSMDGKVVTFDVPTSLVVVYGDCPIGDDPTSLPDGCASLVQVPSPSVNAPEGLDVPKMGEAMLQFLGYSPEEARRLSERIDWTTTLILPIPQGEGIAYQDVTADGVPATFLTHEDSQDYILIWVKNGVLFALQGEGSLADAQAVVATLQ
jgi:hypothetical protein